MGFGGRTIKIAWDNLSTTGYAVFTISVFVCYIAYLCSCTQSPERGHWVSPSIRPHVILSDLETRSLTEPGVYRFFAPRLTTIWQVPVMLLFLPSPITAQHWAYRCLQSHLAYPTFHSKCSYPIPHTQPPPQPSNCPWFFPSAEGWI